MTVPALSAARTICRMRNWSVSNLELQKILYIAHMFHLGKFGGPLINEPFEAWEYGPVVSSVYRRARAFGSGPVQNVFHWEHDVAEGTTEYQMLREAINATREMSAGKMVSITHWDKGAWAACYKPGQRGTIIPNSAILDEYRARQAGR